MPANRVKLCLFGKTLERRLRKTFRKVVVLLVVFNSLVPYGLVGSIWDSSGINEVNAATKTLTKTVDWQAGEYVNTESDSSFDNVRLKADGVWEPRDYEAPEWVPGSFPIEVSDGKYVYMFRGGSDNKFYRYLPENDEWRALPRAPYSINNGDAVVVGGNIYVIFGNYQDLFYKYNIATETWSELTKFPELVGVGYLATDGNVIYATRGNTELYKYDIATNVWTAMPAFATANTYGDLVYNNGYLYHLQNVTGTTHRWYQYNISTGAVVAKTSLPVITYEQNSQWTSVGDYVYVPTGYTSDKLYRYSFSLDTWELMTPLPYITNYYGVVYNDADGYIYIFRNGTQEMYKYDIQTNTILGVRDIAINNTALGIGRGSDTFYYNNKLYVVRGLNTRVLYSYDIPTGVWSQLADIPSDRQTVYQYTRGTLANGKIYFFLSGYPTIMAQFEVYDIATNAWSTLADTPTTVAYTSMVYPGSGDYIYATRGNSTGIMWRYSISGNTWDDVGMPDLPANFGATLGTSFVSDGTNLYLTLGNGVSSFWKYDIGGGAWSELARAPFAIYNGADTNYIGNGKILAIPGNYEKELWEYNIAGNTWRRLPEMPTLNAARFGTYEGGAIESDASGNVYILRGAGSQYILKYIPGSFDYPVSGTWTSGVNDLSYVASWGDLTYTASVSGDSSLTVQTRTSTDRISWTAWQTLSGSTIQSAVGRYIQVKALLTASTDRTISPVLDELVINYTGDTNAPTNPVSVGAMSTQVGGSALTSGVTYSHISPYFSWTGAADVETSVAGYYVYFGTNSGADPAVGGTYQTNSNYTITEPLSAGSYYLKIKTKDAQGNVSSTLDAFTYVYSGIPAEKSLSISLSSEFASGSASEMSLLNDEIKIASRESGLWLQDRFSFAPAIYYGGQSVAYVSETRKLYVFRGVNDTPFYEYDFSSDVWRTLAPSPVNIYIGGGVVEGPSGYLYAFAGNNSTTFLRYSILNNTWDDAAAADAPNTITYGSSLKYDGSRYIYALRGNADDSFYTYDTLSNTWSVLANADFGAPAKGPHNLVYDKADLAYDGVDKIYATQGYNQTGFSSYSIISNSWTLLPDVPIAGMAGSSLEFDPQTGALYYSPGGGLPDFFKFDIASQTWSRLNDAPAGISYGADIRLVDDYLVVLAGNGSGLMWKYKISTNYWQIPTRGLFGKNFYGATYDGITYGGALIKGNGNYLYMTKGNASDHFSRYDTVTGELVTLPALPSGSLYGQNIVYNGANNKIYFTSSLWQKFFVFDIATNAWSEDDAPPALANQYGTTLTYDGSRYIYWTRGGSSSFYRFDYLANSGSRWTSMANIPGAGNSAALVYKNGYIYAVRGDATVSFYRYDVAANTWSDPLAADLPSAAYRAYYGAAITDGGDGYLYLVRGENSNHFLRYSIANNTWSILPNMPAQVTAGAGLVNGGDGKLYMMPSGGSNTFGDGLYVYVLPSTTSGFKEQGIYTSATHSLGQVYRWSNIRLSYQTADETTLKVETRTSGDGSSWSEWSQATEQKILNSSTYEYKINSAINPYIQVRITLTSLRGIRSGVVSDYTVNYIQDSAAPTNPLDGGFTAYSTSTKSAELSSNTWYRFGAPHFTWPVAEDTNGASDTSTGSGVSGYYVYFGTEAGASPLTEGVFQVGNTYTAGGLTSGNTYYLRVLTEDMAGNVAVNVWQPFVYKFDNVAPTALENLAADPSGYSAVNSFDFSWNISTDAASAVSGYCYKTATTSGSLSVDQCTTNLFINDLTAYRTGANTFYVRAKDTAGNYSAYSTVSYYFNNNSPSPVRNLSVTPTSSTSNSFAFFWSTPEVYYGASGNLRYYYSVNALPTQINVTETALPYLNAGPYATLPGDNTFYVVAKDEAGNIDYTSYAQVTFTANTVAPGMPINMDIADVSVKATKSWKLAISWEQPESVGSGVGSYQVYRSTDGEAYTRIATTGGISYVDTGLTQVKYYYKVRACDSANNCGAYGSVVSYLPDGKWLSAASITADPVASDITTKNATVSWSTNRTADSKIAYGTSTGDYLDTEVANSGQVTSHKLEITNLAPGTTYYYSAKWTDEDGNTGESSELTFKTAPAPSSKEVKAVNIGLDRATIQFTSSGANKSKVVYGKTTAFGGLTELSVSSNESTYAILLEGLEDGAKYYYRVDLYDVDGAEYPGDIYSFETLPRPKISNIKLQQVKGTASSTILISWVSNTNISSIVTYYPSSNPGMVKDDVDIKMVTSHTAIIKGLLPDTAYTMVVKGRDKGGNEAVSESMSFTTASDTRPPEITNLNTEMSIQGTGETATAQLIVSWDTDELSTSQIIFGEGSTGALNNKTQVDSTPVYTHLVVIQNLIPSKVYHFKSVSGDKASNAAESLDTVVITPKATQSALNLVVGNLSQAFGFLGGLVGER